MDDERKRKKYTLYLHPEKAADFQTLEAIESVPRSERGELFRNAFISGMALHQRSSPACIADSHFERGVFSRSGCNLTQSDDWMEAFSGRYQNCVD